MPWIKTAIAGFLLLAAGMSTDEKKLAVYSPQTSFTLPVVAREGRDYVGLLEVLEPLGTVASVASGNKWKLRFNQRDAEFTNGSPQCKVNRKDFQLASAFHLENDRGYVPVASLGTLVLQITGTRELVFHEPARRLFVGKVSLRYNASFERTPSPRVLLNFTSAVNPSIATEPGKILFTFNREPVMPPQQVHQNFDDKNITSADFEENNGSAAITISTATPLLASFSNGGRTITLTPAPQAAKPASPPTPPPAAPSAAPASTTGTQPLASGTVLASGAGGQSTDLHHFFAVVDASHGGSERGALLGTLQEKDITLSCARFLQKELQNAGVSVLILRDSDATLTLDQRASLANSAHPVLYIAIHAGSEGKGVRVYTSLMPWEGDARGPFQSWEDAQAPFLPAAQTVASSVASELRKQKLPAAVLASPLQPLNHITSPAIAVEISPQGSDLNELSSAEYQQTVARAVAAGIRAVRSQLEGGK